MKIVVCMKQVPSTNQVEMDPVTNTIKRSGKQAVTNPFDLHCIEAAIALREQVGGKTYAISMGILATERLLRDALSRGMDEAILLSDQKFAGADTLATAYTLAKGIQHLKEGFDLILCGKMAVDGDTAQIGPELAEQLGIPHITDVVELMQATDQMVICKKYTDTSCQVLQVQLPALLTLVKDINIPRFSSIAGVRKQKQAPFSHWDRSALELDETKIGLAGSPTQVKKTYIPQRRGKAISITGSLKEQARQVRELIQEVNAYVQPGH